MRTLRLSLAGTVTLMLLGGFGGAVLAQDDAIDLSAVVPVTGSASSDNCGVVKSARDLDVPGAHRWRDYGLVCAVTMSDPRLNGTWKVVHNGDWYDDAEVFVHWGTTTIDGPDGVWQCSFTATANPFPVTSVSDLSLYVCSGTGDYAGLAFVGYHGTDGPDGFGDGINFVGFIYPGDPPPTWGPPAE